MSESYQSEAKGNTGSRSATLAAALRYASQGWRVLPLEPEGKRPLIKDWPREATTDRTRITAWLNRWPRCNIGVATGPESGILALDVDQPAALNTLQAEHGALPATRTHATGSGGMHCLFAWPSGESVRNSAGKVAPGLDVRGAGGYIVAPPSRTTQPYEVLDAVELADAPAWLLDRLREPKGGPSKRAFTRAGAVSIDTVGPPIPDGTRDDTLARICGRLHDGTRDLDQLTRDLAAVNEARCQPPKSAKAIARIARSICRLEPCKPGKAQADAATLGALAEIEAVVLWGGDWPGAAGDSERDFVAALIRESRRDGERVPAGVRVPRSYAEMAAAMGASKRSLMDYTRDGEIRPGVVSRLKRAGIIRADNAGRTGGDRGAFVLLMPSEGGRTAFHHRPTCFFLRTTDLTSGETLTTPRLRRSVRYIRRLGKRRGRAVDYLELVGGAEVRAELAEFLGIPKRHLDRRVLDELCRAGVVECHGEIVALTETYRDAIERRRLRDGEISAEVRDVERMSRRSEEHRLTLARAVAGESRERVKLPPSDAERYACEELRELADAARERRRVRDRAARARAAVESNPLAAALRAYLRRNPRDASKPASWLGNTLWAYGKVAGRPERRDVERALAELRDGVAA